ncbi:MAG: hypothetical protein AAGF83_02730 [Cyanobacteria bacterium P01_G01_bin.67]
MNIGQIRQQAQDENTAPEILTKLAKSEDELIRKYVASNPNTPTPTLLNLGAEFSRELIDNPVFDLLILENPNFVSDISVDTIRSLVLEENISTCFIEQIACRLNESRSIAEVLCWNPNTSGKIIDSVFESRHQKSCILYITLHPNISENTILKLLKYDGGNPGIYQLISENLCIPDYYLHLIDYWDYTNLRAEYRNRIEKEKKII